MTFSNLEPQLKQILKHYSETFSSKIYVDENHETDPLMDIFGITPAIKRENKQYWGRELGMCWQRIVAELFRMTCEDYLPALRLGDDEPCDCIVGLEAIDTKYRIGSGDSGTLKKFKQYGQKLIEMGYTPVILIVREDNLPAAITACSVGGWHVYQGTSTFQYIAEKSGFNMLNWLQKTANSKEFIINR